MEIKEEANQPKSALPAQPPQSKSLRRTGQTNSKLLMAQMFMVVLLLLLGVYGIWQAMSTKKVITVQTVEAEETARPAELTITVVSDKECAECVSLDGYITAIKQQNTVIKSESVIDISDDKALALVNQYGITKVPFFIVGGEITKHAELEKLWSTIGVVQDDTFVLTNPPAPFYDLSANRVAGRVVVTYVTDESCTDCYDVMRHKTILENNFGMYLAEEKTVDIADVEGGKLVAEYNITQLPTFLVDNEAASYPSLLSVWGQVGSIESDGMYVFRKPELMGAYFDTTKNEVITPTQPVPEATNPNTVQ